MKITTEKETRLNSASDLSKRSFVPRDTELTILARIYDGRVLKVLHGGREWYTANPHWQPPPKVESLDEKKSGPWDSPWRRKREER